ncbi:hypothetical protein F7725_024808 [Dissostichus mawsoni]|uniref:ST8 alpha-N-acetyl-neuraminide alpha-2,8-sialyltransferase 6 n=1 Tax=Dissostichus mawsoni TaxID=36200 RepID=A0A7J5X9C2_DISMA|nr:hypothetical protein F7725_024808 [Dissostichus mawsoni]
MQKEIGMKRHHEKLSIPLMITALCLGSLLITALWIIVDNGSQLRSQCQGFDRAIITQANTPVGSNIVYSAESKRTLMVTPGIFSTFIKENPFPQKKWDTCAVVGNSGILTNSSCGEMIDSAQFVIRCNLPSLGKGYEKHVGTKTDIVTANPTILVRKYGSLNGPRRPFVESLHIYGKSQLLLPAFAFGFCTALCLKAAYSISDIESPIRPTYFNPDYLRRLSNFWRSRGLHRGLPSTGLVMVNIALEHCANVHVYGFWPFSTHPFELNAVKNHYFDDKTGQWGMHSMPAEFNLLLQLHSQGVLRLHLGNCRPEIGMKRHPEKLSIPLTVLCLGSLLITAFWIIIQGVCGQEERGRVCLQKEIGMKRHHEKLSIPLTVLCLGSLLITALWIIVDNGHLVPSGPPSPKKIPPWPSDLCKGCREIIEKVRERYSKTWKKQEDNYRNFSSQLRSQCQGFDRAIITQANTPVGSNIRYSAESKRTLMVTPGIFSTFIKENPFPEKKFDTCAVVGNSGILTNSSCGEMIDSAQFVLRIKKTIKFPIIISDSSVQPTFFGKRYEKHVGTKTDIVTANPTILVRKYGSLNGPRRPFVESLHIYGKSQLLLPAFAFGFCTPLCLKAAYSISDIESPIRPTYFNPDYLRRLSNFWRSRGLHRGLPAPA